MDWRIAHTIDVERLNGDDTSTSGWNFVSFHSITQEFKRRSVLALVSLCSLAGDTARPGELHAGLCHAFVVKITIICYTMPYGCTGTAKWHGNGTHWRTSRISQRQTTCSGTSPQPTKSSQAVREAIENHPHQKLHLPEWLYLTLRRHMLSSSWPTFSPYRDGSGLTSLSPSLCDVTFSWHRFGTLLLSVTACIVICVGISKQ